MLLQTEPTGPLTDAWGAGILRMDRETALPEPQKLLAETVIFPEVNPAGKATLIEYVP